MTLRAIYSSYISLVHMIIDSAINYFSKDLKIVSQECINFAFLYYNALKFFQTSECMRHFAMQCFLTNGI